MTAIQPYPDYRTTGIAWLPQIPEGWSLSKVIRSYSVRMGETILGSDLEEAGDTPVFSATEGEQYFGRVTRAKPMLGAGDLVIPARGNSIGAVKLVLEHATTTQTTIAAIRRKNATVDHRFGFYFMLGLRSHLFEFDRTAIPQITTTQVAGNPLVIPPYAQQAIIVRRLDRETARIDALIEKKTRFIELLKEKRQALITQAVTKGLDPTVPMKDSGVEWIGEVPAHWRLTKLAHISGKIGDGLHGTPSYEDNTKIFFINGNNLVDGRIRMTEKTKEVSTKSHRAHFIQMDDRTVLLSINGTIGNVARYNGEQIVLGKSAAYIACSEKLVPEFLMLSFESGAAKSYFDLEVTGTTIFNLSLQSIREFKICLPDLAEQEKIVATVNAQKEQIDALIGAVSKSIDLLRERRSALITAAVTGQIDLRGEAA